MTSFSHTIVFVRDLNRSIEFYRDTLGLPLRSQSAEWAEFATGSCTLALRTAAEVSAAPSGAGPLPSGHCHVGFTVNSLDEFHARLVERGVKCLHEPRHEHWGGRMAIYADPDGLPVSVAQSTVDVLIGSAGA